MTVPSAVITIGITVTFMYRLDDLHTSSNFQVLQSLYQFFDDCTERTNYNWYHRHFHVPQFFSSLARSKYLSFCSLSFGFTLRSAGTAKFTIRQVLFFCWLSLGLVVWLILDDPFVLLLLLFHSLWYFHSSIGWWSFTRVWVTAILQASSYYSGRSQQCCRLDGLHPSSYFQASSPYTSSLVTVPSAVITIGITVTFMFHCFFNALARSRYLSLFSLLLLLLLLLLFCSFKSFSHQC